MQPLGETWRGDHSERGCCYAEHPSPLLTRHPLNVGYHRGQMRVELLAQIVKHIRRAVLHVRPAVASRADIGYHRRSTPRAIARTTT